MKINLKQILVIILIMMGLISCANLSQALQSIGMAFKGNTKRDPDNYTLENKKEYRRYHEVKKQLEKEQEKEIIKRMRKTSR